ncbi:NAD(P)/FAD-dependent oxidoreductase [Alteromonas sediminis]|uniref:NAD(P)/FAD-dependent oxidoreductase n=1 Tax=Alteromonas sediminis TaxID=2259342 RepID=A0A3N5YFC4_9ALTE|nr:NAD(P)/FAD-dependent oxidoreductase [Alteromonas sediminis]RPJ68715.1 NAD(P)/FAD-dependent oxidoreductase [Alteromonas sediminis]
MKRYRVVIIGSGFGGQCAAIHLLKQNITDFLILERRPFVGGTWVQNRYPGAAVDVQSPLYSLSFEPEPWSRMFAEQAELESYTKKVFKKYGLANKTQTHANVTQVCWQEDEKQWHIRINDSDTIEAKFVINASGPLSTPVIPKIKGQARFQGAAFHTNDWNHGVDLSNKSVAIMGSGASAAQVIPAIIDKVKELHVFQRTPHWVLPRWDRVFKPWQRKLLSKPWAYKALRWLIYWLLEFRIVAFKYSPLLLRLIGERPAKRHLKAQISDDELRAKLTPDYTIGCKRIIVSSTLYPALAHPNTIFHDKLDGITSFTPTGINTASGNTIDVDVMVYGTGYDATDGIISYPVIGRNGKSLSAFWEEYPRAYLGISTPDFPNLFIVTGPNTGIGHTSAIFVIESQMKYILNAIQLVERANIAAVEVTAEAEQEYTEMIHKEMASTVWHNGGCNSWYKSKSGKVTAMFPGFSFQYRKLCKKFKHSHHIFTE